MMTESLAVASDRGPFQRLCIRLASALGDADALVTSALGHALEEVGLAVVTRAEADALSAGRNEYRPASLSVVSLFDRASRLVDQHQFPPATVLLGVMAETAPSPLLSAYRALVDTLEEFDRASIELGSGIGRAAWEVESDLRCQVFNLLDSGPDAEPPVVPEVPF